MLTPNYDHEKIDNPSLADLIDVFEDAWKGYILAPAQVLLNTPNGDIAAVALLSPYFESIEALHRGESSDQRSREFFKAGFLRVFGKISGDAGEPAGKQDAENAAEAIYKNVRSGIAHTGLLTKRVHFQRKKPNAFLITYPRLHNGLDTDKASVKSILINVKLIHDAVNLHLDGYVKTLRQPHKTILQDNFNRLIRSEWGIGEDDNVVGMTEEEFGNQA